MARKEACYRHDVPVRLIPTSKLNRLYWRTWMCPVCGFEYWFDGDGNLLNPFEDDEYNKRFQRHQLGLEEAFGDSPRIIVGVDGMKGRGSKDGKRK